MEGNGRYTEDLHSETPAGGIKRSTARRILLDHWRKDGGKTEKLDRFESLSRCHLLNTSAPPRLLQKEKQKLECP